MKIAKLVFAVWICLCVDIMVADDPLFEGHSGEIRAIEISADGTQLASASMDETVRIWNVSPPKEVFQIKTYNPRVDTVGFCPKSKMVAAGGMEPFGIHVYDYEAKTELRHFPLKAHVRSLTFSPDGKWLYAVTDSDGTIYRWSTETWESANYSQPNTVYFSIAFSGNNKYFVTGEPRNQSASLWNATEAKVVRRLGPHAARVRGVDISPSGDRVCTTTTPEPGEPGEPMVHIWQTSSGKLLGQQKVNTNGLWGIRFSRRGNNVMAGSLGGIFVRETSSMRLIRKIDASYLYPIFSADEKSVIAVEGKNRIRMWPVIKS